MKISILKRGIGWVAIKLLLTAYFLKRYAYKGTELENQSDPSRWITVSSGCKVAFRKDVEFNGNAFVLTTPDGYVIPQQTNLMLLAPVNGPVSAVLSVHIAGIEHNPKPWPDPHTISKGRFITIAASDIDELCRRVEVANTVTADPVFTIREFFRPTLLWN